MLVVLLVIVNKAGHKWLFESDNVSCMDYNFLQFDV